MIPKGPGKYIGRFYLNDPPARNARVLLDMLMSRKGGKIEDSTVIAFALVSIAESLEQLTKENG